VSEPAEWKKHRYRINMGNPYAYLPDALRRSLNTTNLIERVIAQIERKTHRVDHWRTSDQKQRWCAATLLRIEKNFRCIRGIAHLPLACRPRCSSKLDRPPARRKPHHTGITRNSTKRGTHTRTSLLAELISQALYT